MARAKNLKKQQDAGKKAEDGLTPLQRRERLVLYKQSPLKFGQPNIVYLKKMNVCDGPEDIADLQTA